MPMPTIIIQSASIKDYILVTTLALQHKDDKRQCGPAKKTLESEQSYRLSCALVILLQTVH